MVLVFREFSVISKLSQSYHQPINSLIRITRVGVLKVFDHVISQNKGQNIPCILPRYKKNFKVQLVLNNFFIFLLSGDITWSYRTS
jgi:hypothetical protein